MRQETIWLEDIPVAVIRKPTATSPIQVYYIHADHLNTPRVIVNTANIIVWRWENTHPFGANLPDEDPDGNAQLFEYHPRFPGQYFDRETNLHYNYFRYYEPETGRYISPDPIGLAGGLNIYGYASGNSLSQIDPLGLAEYSKIDLVYITSHLRWVFALNYPGENFITSRNAGPERDMLARLILGKDDPQDIAFFRHERAEANFCKPYYNVDSDIARRVQEDAHLRVLRDQQTTSRDLYHPDVIKNYPDLFNKSFFK